VGEVGSAVAFSVYILKVVQVNAKESVVLAIGIAPMLIVALYSSSVCQEILI
jgi:hypothetical protein